jgi:hypothetical protein
MDDGQYVFVVQGRSIKGITDDDFDFGRNVLFLNVSHDQEVGPVVRVSGTFLEPFETTGLRAQVRASIPAGAPAQYAWTADASHLGTRIATYRYGWDIADIWDDSMWEIPRTPYDGSCVVGAARTYAFGTHTFTLEVTDDDGHRTFAYATINVEQSESFNGELDIKPGNCQNIFNARSNGQFTAVLASTPPREDLSGFDALTVDVSTLALEGVAPLSVHVEDVATATDPNYFGCLDATPDGRPDLVMVFGTQAVLAAFHPSPAANSSRLIWCEGELDHPEWGRTFFRTASSVAFIGFPERSTNCLPQAQVQPGQVTTARKVASE